jgi:hypothetical protein
MPDFQGGEGNGSAWYCNDFNAPVLLSSIYASFEDKQLGALDINDVKGAIGLISPSAQNAPVLNYLHWVLRIMKDLA